MIRNQLFLLGTTLTLLGSIGATPVRPLSLYFSDYDDDQGTGYMEGELHIDNQLIESGMRTFDLRGDDVDFRFRDRDFLYSTIAMGSVTLGDELAQSGYFSFAIRASDIWEDEPWAERYRDTVYTGSIAWSNGRTFSQFSWLNRPFRVVGAIFPSSSTPDRITTYADWMGIWYSGYYSGQTSNNAFAYIDDFPTPTLILPPTPAPEPSSIPEPSALLGLFLVGGGCWLKRKLGSK